MRNCDDCGKKLSYADGYVYLENQNEKHVCYGCYTKVFNQQLKEHEVYVRQLFAQGKNKDDIINELKKVKKVSKGIAFDITEAIEKQLKKEFEKTINELSKTTEGREEISRLGSHLIFRGSLWFVGGLIVNIIILLFVAYTSFPFVLIFWGLVVYGFYNILRGAYYKFWYKKWKTILIILSITACAVIILLVGKLLGVY